MKKLFMLAMLIFMVSVISPVAAATRIAKDEQLPLVRSANDVETGTLNGQPLYESRCGVMTQGKIKVERSPHNFVTQKFVNLVDDRFHNKFKGYAVIITDHNGNRLGFLREGWAVDPCENGLHAVPFTLNTESAIGSVTKLLTTVMVLKQKKYASRLEMPFIHYLPRRWRDRAHNDFQNTSIADLLQHKAGFKKSGNGVHISDRLAGGREIPEPPGTRKYSNASMGIFHFIYANWGFKTGLTDDEIDLQNKSDAEYNRKIQEESSRLYNLGLYRQIFKPLKISGTCDPLTSHFPPGQTQYFDIHPVARSYDKRISNNGIYLSDRTLNCAAGGVYMSAKDLAKFISALKDPDFLNPADKERMMNDGPRNDLFGFWALSGAEGGRSFAQNGARNQGGTKSIADVIVFPNGYHVVFLANSRPSGELNVRETLIDAFNFAYTGAVRRD